MKKTACFVIPLLILAATAAAGPPIGDPLQGVTPGKDGMIDVLTVFAHQDDEGFYGGGTLLKLKQSPKVRLHILCMTLGDHSVAHKILGITKDHLGRIRTEELETAAAVYQAEQVIQFQYHDNYLDQENPQIVISEIVNVIEIVGAEIIFTHDPPGITGHPDHIATSKLATEAFRQSSAQKLYYVTFPGWAYRMVYHGPLDRCQPSFKVNIKDQKKMKRMVLYAHASQKHFSEVGWLMEVIRIFNHEYFCEVGSR